MGFLDKIKEIFQEDKKENDKRKIDPEEITSLLEKKNDEIEKTYQDKVNTLYNKVLIILNQLEDDVKKLSEVNLSKRKAEDQYKNITEVGRRDYISIINELIEKLRQKKQGEEEIKHIAFELNNFIKTSTKSDFKTTFLIGKEIDAIKDDIKKIRNSEEEFLKENSQLIKDKNYLSVLLRRNDERKKNIKLRTEIIDENIKVQKDLESHQIRIKEIEKKTNSIKESADYHKRQHLINEKQKKESELKEIEIKLNSLFDSRILEKYIYAEIDREKIKITKKYIENSVQALILDHDLKILEILKEIREKIKKGSIILKDPEKSIEKINVQKETLIKHKEEFLKIKSEIKELEEEINKIKINLEGLVLDKRALEDKISEASSRSQTLNKKENELDKVINDMNEELMKEI